MSKWTVVEQNYFISRNKLVRHDTLIIFIENFKIHTDTSTNDRQKQPWGIDVIMTKLLH